MFGEATDQGKGFVVGAGLAAAKDAADDIKDGDD